MSKNRFNGLWCLMLLVAAGLACSFDTNNNKAPEEKTESQNQSAELPKRLDGYEIKGFKFAYYLIPANLERDDLIKTAKAIHEKESDTQLLLVDDESGVEAYIKYSKAISGAGDVEEPMPQEWADKHIVANLQKHMNGRWVLYKSNGYEEIGDLESSAGN